MNVKYVHILHELICQLNYQNLSYFSVQFYLTGYIYRTGPILHQSIDRRGQKDRVIFT